MCFHRVNKKWHTKYLIFREHDFDNSLIGAFFVLKQQQSGYKLDFSNISENKAKMDNVQCTYYVLHRAAMKTLCVIFYYKHWNFDAKKMTEIRAITFWN